MKKEMLKKLCYVDNDWVNGLISVVENSQIIKKIKIKQIKEYTEKGYKLIK